MNQDVRTPTLPAYLYEVHGAVRRVSPAFRMLACRSERTLGTLMAILFLSLLLWGAPAYADTLDITHTPPADISYEQGNADTISDVLDLHAGIGDGVTLTGLTVYEIGTAGDSDILLVKLIDDQNADGTVDTGEPTIASATLSGGQAVFSSFSHAIPANTAKRVIVTYDISSTAEVGVSVQFHIVSEADVVVAGADSVACFTNQLFLDDWQRADNANSWGASWVKTGFGHTIAVESGEGSRDGLGANKECATHENVVQPVSCELTFKYRRQDATAGQAIAMARYGGTDPESDSYYLLGYDKKNNQLAIERVIAGVHTVLATKALTLDDLSNYYMAKAYVKQNGSATDLKVKTWMISDPEPSYDDTTNALSATDSVGALQNVAGYAGLYASYRQQHYHYDDFEIGEFAGYTGRLVTAIGDKPDTLVVDQTAVDGGDVALGTTDHILQVFDLSVVEDRVTLQGITVNRLGTATDSDTASGSVKLWYDADGNGSISVPDRRLSTSTSFTGGTATFGNIKAMEITDAQPKRFLITASIPLDAIIDRTIGCSVETTASVTVANPDVVTPASTPLASELHTIAPQPPSAPTGLSVTAKEAKQFRIDWSDNNAAEYITTYRIYRAFEGGPYSYVDEAPSSDYTDTVPQAGTYLYKVSAVNRTGESVKSAPEQAEMIDVRVTVPPTSDTTTVESADGSIRMTIPPGYANDQFAAASTAKPSGLQIASDYYYEFTSTAPEPFDPPITITLHCSTKPTTATKIYRYTDQGEWKEMSGGEYSYNGNYISYSGITEFSGYAAVEPVVVSGGYNYPLVNTDTPSGPHGQYTSSSNKCKDCHAGHRALGMYRLTRADVRGESCNFCHGIGGAATKIVVLDGEGHGLHDEELGRPVVAPGDTDPPYSTSSTMWGCLECHSVHNNQTVKLSGYSSNKLLKSDPNQGKAYLYYTPVVGETTQTLSQWCSTCHNANFGASSDIAEKVAAIGSITGLVAGHASSGSGYTTDTGGNVEVNLDDGVNDGPTCRQCHPSDGGNSAVGAKFPHTSGTTPDMLSSESESTTVDGVCIACHDTAALN